MPIHILSHSTSHTLYAYPFYCPSGKSIGKHVFLSRSNINGIGGFAKNGEVQVDNRARLKELEAKFYKSLCQESDSSLGMAFVGHTAFPAFLQSQVRQAALSNVPLPATVRSSCSNLSVDRSPF